MSEDVDSVTVATGETLDEVNVIESEELTYDVDVSSYENIIFR